MNKQSTISRLLEIDMPPASLRLVLSAFEEYAGSFESPPLALFSEPVVADDPIKARINALYKRRPTTAWSIKEQTAYKRARIAEEDLQIVERARQLGYQYYRKDIFTLLNNWNAEVDRSRAYILDEADYKHPN